MTDRPVDRLEGLLNGGDWVKGAVNYDEDLHFSTFYLRAPAAGRTAPLYPGYSAIVAFYEDCNETYYLLKSECLATAAAVVRKALRRPDWLPRVLAEIYRRSDSLARAFPAQTSATRLARLADDRLLALLRGHGARQRSLYRVARLPEALDRGVSYFSDYLTGQLRRLGVPESEADETFAVLAQPAAPSVLAQELLDFDRIVQGVRARPGAAEGIASHGARAHLFLEPDLLRELDAHRARWQFLHYHGYGRREPATPRQYLDRLLDRLRLPDPGAPAADLRRRIDRGRAERQQLLDRLPLDGAHRRLFELYPEIGAAKLYRRRAQVRNFFYLDLLLAEVARRLGTSEWVVRCMIPEEVEAALGSRLHVIPLVVEERLSACMYALLGDDEHVVGGEPARAMARRFREKTRAAAPGGTLTGVVASRGKATGRCKVIIRADDVHEEFAPGTIVVSESTDPDLLPFLERAGGVVTEQGGVTSHAAVICRELGVPTVIGVEGLLGAVHDGDVVEVDAIAGTVRVVERGPCRNGQAAGPDTIGAKAHNLGVVRALGFNVPEFAVLEFETARRLLDHPADEEGLRRVERALARVGLAPGETLAVRSSAAGEDGAGGSLAGEFRSLLRVPAEGLAAALREFAEANRAGQRGTAYRGGLIVQRMVAGEWAGVCLTLDRRTGRGNAVIIEMAAGGNEGITGGSARPDRLVVDRLTGDVLEAERRGSGAPGSAPDVGALVQQFLALEAGFGTPLDIEWAWAGGKLYILQARPIANGAG